MKRCLLIFCSLLVLAPAVQASAIKTGEDLIAGHPRRGVHQLPRCRVDVAPQRRVVERVQPERHLLAEVVQRIGRLVVVEAALLFPLLERHRPLDGKAARLVEVRQEADHPRHVRVRLGRVGRTGDADGKLVRGGVVVLGREPDLPELIRRAVLALIGSAAP